MRTHRALSLLLAALVALTTLPGRAEDKALLSPLLRNAWYWQARARSDKAEEAWEQVLQAAPDNPEALAALGGFHARAGRRDQAREVLAHLEKVSPGHPDVPVLRRELELGPRFGPTLARARKLVHEGHPAEGAAVYRELFGAAGPPGDLALEYYATIGGVPGRWEEARNGLRSLVRRAPAEPRYRLALGRLLTWREEGRREGLEVLASLARDPSVGKEATIAWREALLWLGPGAGDAPFLQAWLRSHEGDAEIAARLNRARKADTLKEGFSALERGQLDEAERIFRSAGADAEARRGLSLLSVRRAGDAKKEGFAALQRGDLPGAAQRFERFGDDPDARVGLALVAQRQALAAQLSQDFVAAKALLLRARSLAPGRRDLWEEQLRTVEFWGGLREASSARAAGRAAEAEERLLAAIAGAPPRDRWNARLALADLEVGQGKKREAEGRYRDVLSELPDQPAALRGLLGLLVEADRFDEALPVNDRLLRVAPRDALQPGWLRAQLLRRTAQASRASGDLLRAWNQLAEAVRAAPQDVWALHDLANLLLEMRAPAQAQPLVARLLRLDPSLPEAQLLQARLLEAQGDVSAALAVLDELEPPRAPAVLELRRSLEVRVRIPQLLALAGKGERAEAVSGLAELEQRALVDPALAARVSVAWSRLGEHLRALSLMRLAVAKAPAATRGPRLELASTLLEAGEESALAQLLDGLEGESALSPDERRALTDLRIARAVRLADRQREGGRPGDAAMTLEPLLREQPDDPRLAAAEARALEQAEPARAHQLYLGALRRSASDQEARRGAVDTALALRATDEARGLAEEGVQLHPLEARAQWLLAQVALRQADDETAANSLRETLRLLSLRAAVRGDANVPAGSSESPGGQADAAATSSSGALPAGDERRAAFGEENQATELRAQALRELERIEDRHRPAYTGYLAARLRDGEAGLSALTDLRQSVQAQAPLGYSGHARIQVSQLELDAGAVGGFSARRFGSGGPADGSAARISQRATGTELRFDYERGNLSAWLATTPLGFPLFTLLGGGRLRAPLGPLTIVAEASRRSVTESLLSWASTSDPVSGQRWGGVVRDGGRLELSLSLGPGSLYAYGEGDRLLGLRVEDNSMAAGGAGATLSLEAGRLGTFSLGPTFAALGYSRNLRFFTVGHGGYFSPQRFLHGGFALGWRGSGDLHWELVAEPGYDWFAEEAVAALPLADPQAQRGLPAYPSRESSGGSFNGRGFLGWKIGGGWETGIDLAALRAPEFQELRAGVLVRYNVGARE